MTTARYSPSPEQDEAAWLEWRKGHIGGSEIAAVFDLHPSIDQVKLWRQKTGREGETKANRFMQRGRALEGSAADYYAEVTGRKIRRVRGVKHPEHEFLGASADREIIGENAALELKVVSWRVFAQVKSGGLQEHHVLQGVQEAMCLGKQFTDFGIMNADSWSILTGFDLAPPPGMVDRIVNEAGEWWERHVVRDTMPEVQAPWEKNPEPRWVPKTEGEILNLDADPEFLKACQDYREAKAIEAAAKGIMDQAKQAVQDALTMNDTRVAEADGVRWYAMNVAGRKTIDKDKLLAAGINPDDFTKVGKPSQFVRAFILKTPGE